MMALIENYRRRKREEALYDEVASIRDDTDAITSAIGIESDDNHAEGEAFSANGRLYVATRNISRGEKVVDGINAKPTTVIGLWNEINSKE